MTKRIHYVAGRHCIEGVDMSVEGVMILMQVGMNTGEVANKFPELDEDDVKACVQYYLENIQ